MSDLMPEDDVPGGAFLLYQTEDGRTRLEVRLEDDTVWLTQKLMAELFQIGVNTVNHHLKAIFAEGELQSAATIRRYRIVQTEGSREISREVEHYRLEAILAVGYRVRSHRGTQFRQWATSRLSEYVVKGFAMDDERLKQRSNSTYFEELLARIRDIRSSEKEFWRKVLEIYATSIDYDPGTEASQSFFATVQNKVHWAAHGHTAAEVIHARVNATKPQVGMTNLRPTRAEAVIAKNYLLPEELNALNRIVTAFLEVAELEALNHRPMYMRDWISKLDDLMRLSGRDVLKHAGRISHEQAAMKAELEFENFRRAQLSEPTKVERDFDAAVKSFKNPAAPTRKKKKS